MGMLIERKSVLKTIDEYYEKNSKDLEQTEKVKLFATCVDLRTLISLLPSYAPREGYGYLFEKGQEAYTNNTEEVEAIPVEWLEEQMVTPNQVEKGRYDPLEALRYNLVIHSLICGWREENETSN